MLFALLLALATAEAKDASSIPVLASRGGIRVGFDSMQRLDRRLGPAHVSSGGHPGGIDVERDPLVEILIEAL